MTMNLVDALRKETNDNPNMTVDEFYDKYKVPKEARTDFGTAALLNQAFPEKKIMYKIDNGDMFEGDLNQFKDCFFSNATTESIKDWCNENNFKLEIYSK